MMNIDYQPIINSIGDILKIAIPIGMLFGVSGKLANALISMVFGERRVKL